MPKVPVDYNKTIIYKLVHKDDVKNENIYVGSTTNFVQRKWDHATCCNGPLQKSHQQLKYQYIRENGGWKNWLMIEIEKYPCNIGSKFR